MRKNFFIFLLVCLFFACVSQPLLAQSATSTGLSNESLTVPLPSGTDLLGNLPSLSALTQQALIELQNLEQTTGKLFSTLDKFGIPLTDLESYLQQQTLSLNSMRQSLNSMGERLQAANEDYAAEQEYHAKIENGLKIKTTALTVTVCVTGAVAVGAIVWALVK